MFVELHCVFPVSQSGFLSAYSPHKTNWQNCFDKNQSSRLLNTYPSNSLVVCGTHTTDSIAAKAAKQPSYSYCCEVEIPIWERCQCTSNEVAIKIKTLCGMLVVQKLQTSSRTMCWHVQALQFIYMSTNGPGCYSIPHQVVITEVAIAQAARIKKSVWEVVKCNKPCTERGTNSCIISVLHGRFKGLEPSVYRPPHRKCIGHTCKLAFNCQLKVAMQHSHYCLFELKYRTFCTSLSSSLKAYEALFAKK